MEGERALVEVARAFLVLEGGNSVLLATGEAPLPISELLKGAELQKVSFEGALAALTGGGKRSVALKTKGSQSLALALTHPLEAVVKVVWAGEHTTVFGGPLDAVLDHCYLLSQGRVLLATVYLPNGQTATGSLADVIAALHGGNRAIA